MIQGRAFFRKAFMLAIVLTALSSVAWGSCGSVVSNTVTCTNTATITANIGAQGSPYPSTIAVAGLTGNVTNVTLTLNGVTSPATDLAGVQLLLLAPNGTKLVF